MSGANLYSDGRIYDLLYRGDGEDTAFYISLADRFGGPVLELACGTGKYLLPLARGGHDVWGMDLAAAMLEHAAAKARGAGVPLRLSASDMRDFRLDKQFRLIMLAGNSACHLVSADEFSRCAKCVREHLAPDGVFVVDVFVPDARLLARDSNTEYAFGAYDDPDDGARVAVTYRASYDPISQISHVTLLASRDGGPTQPFSELTLKMWYPCELEAALRQAGFHVDERYGNHHGGELNANSGKQILICRPGVS
ncbi:MAG: class I SAM-dependent methyltransferase [Planctomycetes bacterium]|nr:class I SAM-dependent methyltransferase [Planctomycetota bacterium]